MARHGEYLFKRRGSQNWWIRFQYPEHLKLKLGRKVEVSLGTPDRKIAEIEALSWIRAHKLILYGAAALRNGTATAIESRHYEPGPGISPQGQSLFATPTQIHYLNACGEIEKVESNVREVMDLGLTPAQEQDLWAHGIAARPGMVERRVAPSKNDDAHVERWIKHRGLDGYIAMEARAVWALFRQITGGKALRDCDRDDGRKLATHLFEIGNKSGTVKKKVGHLCAAVNLAIDEGKLKFNPFANIVEQRKDASVRWPMPSDDMALVRKNLDLLGPEERLLWMLCSTTGMRRGEACSIDREYNEKGIRFVIVGSKTDASLRRIPLPSAVMPLLPAEITGPLFTNTPKNVGRNLLRAIRRFGVTGELKDIHALRHRAKDRLRAEDCPGDMQDWILGHDEMTVSVNYGEGPSVTKLRPWVEKIGY